MAGTLQMVEIGRTVQFLKELRCQKTYEHKMGERSAILDEAVSGGGGGGGQKMWYNPKSRGKLYSIVGRLSRMVSEDALQELLVQQRLLDHIGYIHHLFYLLHGDFVARLEDAI